MTILCVFPHPDDESFGPAPVIYKHIKKGDKVHLLTLTRGENTKVRLDLNVSKEEMGEIRIREMEKMKQVLNLTSMTVLDYPDQSLHEMDPIVLERVIKLYIDKVRPDIIISYPVHGISGHHDHIATHAVVKRIFSDLKKQHEYKFLKRLAFITLPAPEDAEKEGGNAYVHLTKPENIDCVVKLNEEEIEILKKSLYCYETFTETIEESGVIDKVGDKVHFEFFGERINPQASSLDEKLQQ